MLELPPTIRQPLPNELPNNDEVKELMKKRSVANIVEGYKIIPNTTHPEPFTFYAEININNSRLWDLFIALSKILPDHIGTIYNLYEEKPFYGPYYPKQEIINLFTQYKLELTQDGFLEFGIIFNTKDKLEEIFIPEAKYIKFWGVNEASFRQTMNNFNLNEIRDINFIDQFPKVIESLSMKNNNAKQPEKVIEELNTRFKPKQKNNWKFWKS